MKKHIALAAALICLICLTVPAFAQDCSLTFTQRSFYGGQTLPVYQGPGHEYGRGANGWAKAYTDNPLYAAGKENGWALVMYSTGNGTVRTGYVDLGQFHYNVGRLKLQTLDFEYSSAKITRSCTLTDDPVLASRETAYLRSGASVTYLGSFYKHRSWAYIETWADGRPIRGFVPESCISVN